ncbi:hypothetical protein [Bifidobacterium tibiigranuli]|uniref:DUF3168 domain-containing protein n=1 Tax=Bifidobacterium tibiigranuli TaxID=2172043 RepID=A0A5N6RXZ6_9BIFI|nr:hypothetical protein [Bifidobacterium tibiigranuli]KAE8127296.1 hypothetical protein DDF78_08720 [Bifidobacterium tibiigranuli]KAE8129687.1 hypothetical protein DDE84_02500 [Bifidobacterium tibiigranuli]
MSTVLPTDLEAWACTYLNPALTDVRDLQVGNREPSDYRGGYPLIVVSETVNGQSERVVFDTTLAVTVRGWSRSRPKPCKDLARRVYGLLTADPDILEGHAPDSRILALDGDNCKGPYPITEDLDVACYYMTFTYAVDGEIHQ